MNDKEFNELIMNWLQESYNLEVIKEKEMKFRKQVALIVLQEERLESFTKTLRLGNDYKIKATNIINYKLDETEKIVEVIDKLIEGGFSDLPPLLFKWKASLSESTYKALKPEIKAIIDEILTIKIGAPQLEFIEPKVKT